MPDEDKTDGIVDSFLRSFRRERDFYMATTRRIASRCEELTQLNAIRAIVTHRVKRIDKLEKKLIKRHSTRNYSNHEEIRDDIPDFGGVRIALYFPGDQDRLCSLIEEHFAILSRKIFPNTDQRQSHKDYKTRFDGYKAVHYGVTLNRDNLDDSDKDYADTGIEIQIGSVLMHAWAEVEHDLIYKPEAGDLSIDEYAILDEINGLVLAGEIALERLQRVIESRITRGEGQFRNVYEFSSYLYERYKAEASNQQPATAPKIGEVDLLFRLLKDSDLLSQVKLEAILQNIQFDHSGMIAPQVIDEVIKRYPAAKELYFTILNSRAQTAPARSTGAVTGTVIQSLSSRVLAHWHEVVEVMARLAARTSPSSLEAERRGFVRNRPSLDQELLEKQIISAALHEKIRHIKPFVRLITTGNSTKLPRSLLIEANSRLLEIRKELSSLGQI